MSQSERIQDIAQEILAAFEQGRVPAALAQIFLYPPDLVFPSFRWSYRNRFIAAIFGHVDARGFQQWKEVGRSVRKGERCFHILGPCTRTAREDDPERGIEAGDRILFGFKVLPVFGYSQTEGEPIPEHEAAERRLPELPLVEVARAWSIEVIASPTHLRGAQGSFRVPGEASQIIELAVSNLSTWAHELVHAADLRLGQLLGSSYLSREVVAELGGAILLEATGHTHASDRGGAYEYILHLAKDEGRTAFEVSSELIERTCKCVDLILRTAEEICTCRSAA